MGRKTEKNPAPAKPGGAHGSPQVASSAPDALDRELRELHDRYGADTEIPERLVELARRVAEAHGRLDRGAPDPTAEGEGRPA